MTERKKPPAGHGWKKGQSGNPAGRPKGSGEVAKLRSAIAGRVPEILDKLMRQALEGDTSAARLLLERAIAPLKAAEQPQAVNLAGDSLTDQGRAVLRSVAAGELAPGAGAALLAGIGQLSRVAEIDELAARGAVLEKKHGNT